MRLKTLLFLCFALPCLSPAAQDSAAKKAMPAFHALALAGLVEGDKSSSFQLQVVNGFACKSWYAGIGTGIDYYFRRSIPLTAYVEKKVSSRLPFFLYGSAGVHFVWTRKITDEMSWLETDHNTGLYYDAGFGYRFEMSRNASIRLSLGFSEKQIRETTTQTYIWGPPNPQTLKEIYDYRLKRLSIKAGFQF